MLEGQDPDDLSCILTPTSSVEQANCVLVGAMVPVCVTLGAIIPIEAAMTPQNGPVPVWPRLYVFTFKPVPAMTALTVLDAFPFSCSLK